MLFYNEKMLYFSWDKLIRKIHLLLRCFIYISYFRLNYFMKCINIVKDWCSTIMEGDYKKRYFLWIGIFLWREMHLAQCRKKGSLRPPLHYFLQLRATSYWLNTWYSWCTIQNPAYNHRRLGKWYLSYPLFFSL